MLHTFIPKINVRLGRKGGRAIFRYLSQLILRQKFDISISLPRYFSRYKAKAICYWGRGKNAVCPSSPKQRLAAMREGL